MTFAEVNDAAARLSSREQLELIEKLQALQEGISVEEMRALNAAIDEAVNDPSPSLTVEEVQEEIRKVCRNAASA